MTKAFIDFTNFLIVQLAGVLGVVANLLPDSIMVVDFDSLSLGPIPPEWISTMNYFLPVQEIVWFLEIVAGILAVYYGRIVILRIVRLIH